MITVILLGLVFTDLVLEFLLARFDEHLKVTFVSIYPLGLHVKDVGCYGVEELSVMGHTKDGSWPRLEETRNKHNQILGDV